VKTVNVNLPHHRYDILVGRGLFQDAAASTALGQAVAGRRCLLLTDTNVGPLYADAATRMLLDAGATACTTATICAGEQSKNLDTVADLYHQAVAAGLDRKSIVVALGGGVVGDISGFVAATYMRGIPFVQIPTSLLALVDSSVGGKVGVDLPEGKNLVGAFHQPELVLADVELLKTLPERELACGLAEVAKYGVIMDAALFDLLSETADRLNGLDLDLLETVVAWCCRLKAEVVIEDEKEAGRRAILNYGHTFGHAIEALGDYTALNHGEGVAIGMGMAADLAVALRMWDETPVLRQDALLRALRLPTQWNLSGVTAADILANMYRDKKVLSSVLRLVLPREIGHVHVVPCQENELIRKAIEGRRAKP